MLSRLFYLLLYSIKDIDDQADVIIICTDPLYNPAALVQSYTQHVLRPHIDSLSDKLINTESYTSTTLSEHDLRKF